MKDSAIAVPVPFCTEYRFNIYNGVVVIEGGHQNAWHTGIALALPLAIDMHQKLGDTIANLLRANAAEQSETAAAAIEAATTKKH